MTAPVRDASPPVPHHGRWRWRWRWVVAATVTVCLAVAVTWIVAFSSVLGARTVRVRGAQMLTADQVRAAAAIRVGTPLVRLDTAQVTRRVQALPDVAAATVSVSYPTTVLIMVRERIAVGYLADTSDSVLVDVTGRQFRTVARPPAGLPRFDVAPGQGSEDTARAVAVVAGALPPALRRTLSVIRAGDLSAIQLNLRDGRSVRWGGADRSADKALILPALLGRPGAIFDVSDPDLAVVR